MPFICQPKDITSPNHPILRHFSYNKRHLPDSTSLSNHQLGTLKRHNITQSSEFKTFLVQEKTPSRQRLSSLKSPPIRDTLWTSSSSLALHHIFHQALSPPPPSMLSKAHCCGTRIAQLPNSQHLLQHIPFSNPISSSQWMLPSVMTDQPAYYGWSLASAKTQPRPTISVQVIHLQPFSMFLFFPACF